jgi:thiazole/oxazole-forming peptide maturase SagD family component
MKQIAYGSDEADTTALSKAIGESIERLITLWERPPKSGRSISMSNRLARDRGLDTCFPPDHHTYTEDQILKLPLKCVTHDTVIGWAKGRNLHTGKEAYIPEQLLYRTIQRERVKDEGIVHEMTSNGSAGWFTEEGAIIRGLYELVERDTVMKAWLTKKSFDKFDVSTIQGSLGERIRSIKHSKLEISFLDGVNEFLIPTIILCVIDSAYQEKQVYVTAHSGSDLEDALRGAVYELYAFLGQERKVKRLHFDYKPYLTKDIDRTERAGLWCGQEQAVQIQKLWSGNTIPLDSGLSVAIQFNTEKEHLGNLVGRIVSSGEEFTPYAFIYRHPILTKTGYHVAKCFIPALFPLYLTEHLAPIKSKRLGTDSLSNHNDILGKINSYPHPFL